ncbi:MAG: rod shape-determining protein MreD [bacterium]
MYGKIFLNIIFLITLTALQLSFLNSLPRPFGNFSLVIIVLIFMLGLRDDWLAIWWAAGVGVLFDFFSFYPFGIYIVSFSAMILLTKFLLVNFITNRSLYSFLTLCLFAGFIYKFFVYLLIFLLFFLEKKDFPFIMDKSFFFSEFIFLAINSVGVAIIFYLLSKAVKKLRPAFFR